MSTGSTWFERAYLPWSSTPPRTPTGDRCVHGETPALGIRCSLQVVCGPTLDRYNPVSMADLAVTWDHDLSLSIFFRGSFHS